MKFDDRVSHLLNETYFGGTPNQRTTGIQRQVTFEDNGDDDDSLGELIAKELSEVKPYGYGDKSGNPTAQSEMDDIIEGFLDGLDLVKVGDRPGIAGDMTVYSLPDDIKEEFGEYTLVAYSEKDLGDTESLFPLDKFYSVLIGKQNGAHGGIPKIGKGEKIYDGPAKDLSSLSKKEPAGGVPPAGKADAGIDYDQIRKDVQAAKDAGMMKQ
jgi:hypothetical protein